MREFLKTLEDCLKDQLPYDEVRSVLEYYESYIQEAMDFGRSEEDILQELGDPREIARDLLRQVKPDMTLDQILDQVFKKIQDVTERMSESLNRQYHGSFQESLDDVQEIRLNLKNGDLEMDACDEGDFSLSWESSEENCVTVVKENGILLVTQVNRRFFASTVPVKVSFPAGFRGKVTAREPNGRIVLHGHDRKIYPRLTLHCVNGSTLLDHAICGYVTIHCANGRVVLDHCVAYQADLNCTNGKIRYDMLPNPLAKELDLRASNGRVTIDGKKFSNYYQKTLGETTGHTIVVKARALNGRIILTGVSQDDGRAV